MTTKPKASFDVRSLVIRDNVPEGMTVSLADLPPSMSFASMFRDELQARGIGIKPREAGHGRKRLD